MAGSYPLTIAASPLPVVTVTATVPRVSVGNGSPGGFTLILPAALPDDLFVRYTVKGSAINGIDDRLLTGTQTIKAGQTSARIKVLPRGDLDGASRKVVRLILEPGADHAVGTVGPVKVEISAGN